MTNTITSVNPSRTLRSQGRINFEDPDLIRKRGDLDQVNREAEAMDFVRRQTSIPVPAVVEVHLDDENSCILMR